MVRTRFAPSPTGYLHIGGVRTALFNWLFARHHGGQFILRIDDTDQSRNVEAALAPILAGLKWLGLNWDEGPDVDGPHAPYYQSGRAERHRAAADELLARGAAYRDFARPEEIQAEREAAQQSGTSFVYSRRWMAETREQAQKFEAEGRSGVVRLKMPREGTFVLQDHIRGEVRFDWASEQDHVIQRANGSCLYHLASVVDDHDMRISHVIRAEEHLPNTPRQAFIAQSLGYPLPEYAHVPYVAEPGSKNKLSKRKLKQYLKHRDFAQLCERGQALAEQIGLSFEAETFNPVVIDFYEAIGFLPHALLNYLLLLGWSWDDKTEFFTLDEMVSRFSLERVNKAPASLDLQKLLAFQDHYMREFPPKQKTAMVLPYLQRADHVSSPPPCDVGPYVTQILEAAGDRVKIAGDILDYTDFFVSDDALVYDERAFQKRIRKPPEAAELLRKFRQVLQDLPTFEAASLQDALQRFIEAEGIAIGQIIHALRVAVTGKAVGFGMFETLAILGRQRSLKRIDQTLSRIEA